MRTREVYVIKDSVGRYCGSNSLHLSSETQKWKCITSEFLTNGFITYKTEEACNTAVEALNAQSKSINWNEVFHTEKIDRFQVIEAESSKKIPRNPFKSEFVKIQVNDSFCK